MGKRTRITIEIDSLAVLRERISLRAFCPRCHAQAEMIGLHHLGSSDLAGPGVKEGAEPSDFHRIQTADGAVLICLNSILKQLNRGSRANLQLISCLSQISIQAKEQ